MNQTGVLLLFGIKGRGAGLAGIVGGFGAAGEGR